MRMASSYMGYPVLRPMIMRCQFCGREVREDWTPAQSPDAQLCWRCTDLVREPAADKWATDVPHKPKPEPKE